MRGGVREKEREGEDKDESEGSVLGTSTIQTKCLDINIQN